MTMVAFIYHTHTYELLIRKQLLNLSDAHLNPPRRLVVALIIVSERTFGF